MANESDCNAVLKRLSRLETIVGIPSSENQKALTDIVIQLNKEILELRLKIEDMDAKEKDYVID